ncbi:hypothetical protein C1637_24220 [Chryseobacterium lactis]|uniref:Four helix bundle protein n=1 Tax=Chryseobacterium lactis TaxID=1241981 RepID=A0A3G6RNC5_CHRLC|nr:hypothetical protein EG342_15645 [Chryseobacterium lactis]AZB03604.1 hypothetical protein EG341_06515 [Chryseobacterium lactis]PNW11185.1 hypothetical protein C1637_24220 [Chryseobacterium lactis]
MWNTRIRANLFLRKVFNLSYDRCLLLRKKVLELQELDLWKIDLIKTNEKWREVIVLCDKIKDMIKKIK